MIKRFSGLLMVFVLLATAFPLYPQPLGPSYVVYFTDKDNSPYSIDNPSEFLTAAALDRRSRQGIDISMDDIPVNASYIQAVTSAGAQIAAVSRWFNTVAVWIYDADIIPLIADLPFVLKVEPMSQANNTHTPPVYRKNKEFFEIEESKLPAVVPPVKSFKNDFFNYGSGFNQIDMVNGIGLHNQGFRGQGMVIAVLDAGFRKVDVNPAFDSLRAHNRILGTRDFVTPGNNVYHPGIHAHGANVLSIMAANLPGQMVGSAPDASYWLIRTEDADGPYMNSEYLMEEYFWISGAEFADSVGAWVINSSLGYADFFDDPSQNHTYSDMDGNTTPVTRGANRATAKGILVVNSAGNSGDSPWQHIIAPSDGFDVMAIGAVNANGAYAFFSSKGPSYDGRVKPDVTAQGLGTTYVSSGGSVLSGNGTSYSSPIIAGMAACLWQTQMDASSTDVRNAIRQSASQYLNPDHLLGYGIPDFSKAHFLLTFDSTVDVKNGTVNLFPNPANEFIIIRLQKAGDYIRRIEISDLSGRLLMSRDYKNSQQFEVRENLSRLDAGIYLVRIDLAEASETIRLIRF